MMHMTKIMTAIMAFAALAIAAGCSTMETAGNSLTAQVAVQQATLRVAQDDPARAERIQEIVAEVRPYIEQDTATVALIDGYVRAQVPWASLSTADAQLLLVLLDELRNRLEARIGEGMLDPRGRASILRVLDWVHDAAGLVVVRAA
jgi:hypothetical protein